MSSFVITKRFNELYKFEFTSRKGKTIFTSVSFELKFECHDAIALFKTNLSNYKFETQKTTANKYIFHIYYNNELYAVSRKYSTQLLLEKGITDIKKYAQNAEVLDFDAQNFVFDDSEQTIENEHK